MNQINNLFDPDPSQREENIFRALELVQTNYSLGLYSLERNVQQK
jgi:hypothetical protein